MPPVEGTTTVKYTDTKSKVFSLDPVDVMAPLRDWEGYLILEELSGNNVTVEIYTEAGGIENPDPEETFTLSANGKKVVTLYKSKKYNIYMQGPAGVEGQVKIGYRITHYFA